MKRRSLKDQLQLQQVTDQVIQGMAPMPPCVPLQLLSKQPLS